MIPTASREALTCRGIFDTIVALDLTGWSVQYGDLVGGGPRDQQIGVTPYDIGDTDLRIGGHAADIGVQVLIRGSAHTGIDPGLNVRQAILAAIETRTERTLPNGYRIAYCLRRLATPKTNDGSGRPQWFDSYYVRSGIGPA